MATMEINRTDLLWAGDSGVTPEPTDQELRILRDEVDPAGFAIGRR
jgi:hypothetical protein